MRKILALLALVVATLGLAIPAFAQERPTIAEWLESDADGRFGMLVAALNVADLTGSLSEEGPFTLFAPTDEAIAAFLESSGMSIEGMMASPEMLAAILSYHVVPGRYQFVNLTAGPELETLQGESLQIMLDAGVLYANDVVVSDPDAIASNGVVHIIDSVLVPPSLAVEPAAEATEAPVVEAPVAGTALERPSIVEALAADADGRFTTLAMAVEAAGLSEALSGEGPFTVFAPTNDAFAAALEAMGTSVAEVAGNPEMLTAILSYHVVPGRYQFVNLTAGPELETLQGEPLQITLDAGVLYANDVVISDIDLLASNGVVQVLDGVLMPPSMAAAPVAEATEAPVVEAPVAGVALERPSAVEALSADADGRFTTFVAALEAAGLTGELPDDGSFTVLAPTNDAFAAALEAMGTSAAEVAGNPEMLAAILSYHIIPGRYQFVNLTAGPELHTLQGEPIQFLLDGGILYANDVVVSDIDMLTSNGVVHVLDGVLMPPSMAAAPVAEATEAPVVEATEAPVAGTALERPSVLETLAADADGRFTTLAMAIEAAGLTEALSGEGPFTVLAPTNDAFAAAMEALGLTPETAASSPELLAAILSYHVIPGRYQFVNLTAGPALDTLEGSPVQFRLDGGVLTANNAIVGDIDMLASNGVIHALEGVLMPPSAAAVIPVHMRVAHLSPDSGSVDVYVNNALALEDLAFSAVSPWMVLPAGTYSVAVAPAGTSLDDAILGPIELPLAVNSWVTVAAVGSSSGDAPTLAAQIIPEDYNPIAEGNARVTALHAIEGGPSVNVLINGSATINGLQFPGSYNEADGSPNDGAYTVELAAGTYDIVVQGGGAVLFELPDTTLEAGTNYILMIAGTVDSPLPVFSATAQ
ncbi:MAG: fasciclin domain-containing protein [Anaerolineae bacterium]|nr:fasciclin domain-containing protein [Anaerolineae bacterium]